MKPIMSQAAYNRWQRRRAWNQTRRQMIGAGAAIAQLGTSMQEASDAFAEFGAVILAQADATP